MTIKDVVKVALKALKMSVVVIGGIAMILLVTTLLEMLFASCFSSKEAIFFSTLLSVLFLLFFIAFFTMELQDIKYNKQKDKDGKR